MTLGDGFQFELLYPQFSGVLPLTSDIELETCFSHTNLKEPVKRKSLDQFPRLLAASQTFLAPDPANQTAHRQPNERIILLTGGKKHGKIPKPDTQNHQTKIAQKNMIY